MGCKRCRDVEAVKAGKLGTSVEGESGAVGVVVAVRIHVAGKKCGKKVCGSGI